MLSTGNDQFNSINQNQEVIKFVSFKDKITLYLWNNIKHAFAMIGKYYNSHAAKLDQPPTIKFWLSSPHVTPTPKAKEKVQQLLQIKQIKYSKI